MTDLIDGRRGRQNASRRSVRNRRRSDADTHATPGDTEIESPPDDGSVHPGRPELRSGADRRENPFYDALGDSSHEAAHLGDVTLRGGTLTLPVRPAPTITPTVEPATRHADPAVVPHSAPARRRGVRALDVTAAIGGIVVLSPVLAAAAIATRVTAGRGVIYKQDRLGLGGQPFELLKFRTMRHAASGKEGPQHDCARLTPLGKWFRATSIDELPSLWNLLRGDVTLVGPRPLPVHYWNRFRGDEYERFEVPAGITGLAQVSGRNSLDWPERLALDVEYVRTRTWRGDLRILCRTVSTVISSVGVDQGPGVTMTELPRDRPEPPSSR